MRLPWLGVTLVAATSFYACPLGAMPLFPVVSSATRGGVQLVQTTPQPDYGNTRPTLGSGTPSSPSRGNNIGDTTKGGALPTTSGTSRNAGAAVANPSGVSVTTYGNGTGPLTPNSGAGKSNGSKPAVMQPNGVMKIN